MWIQVSSYAELAAVVGVTRRGKRGTYHHSAPAEWAGADAGGTFRPCEVFPLPEGEAKREWRAYEEPYGGASDALTLAEDRARHLFALHIKGAKPGRDTVYLEARPVGEWSVVEEWKGERDG